MNEKELFEKQKRVAEIMKGSIKNPQEAIKQLEQFQTELDKEAKEDSVENEILSTMIGEAMGDCYMKLRKIADAEIAYQKMLKFAIALYKRDAARHDYRLGAAYYKFGCFYRNIIGCQMLSPKKVELKEPQKQGFKLAEQCLQSAVECTKSTAAKGSGPHIELHGHCFEALMILHNCVGDREKAIACGKTAVNINKKIYEVKDQIHQGMRLANVMNGLAAIYSFAGDHQNSMECLEDAIYVLEEHEAQEPDKAGLLLARYYISLGSCYSMIEEEKENAEEAYKKGLNRIIELNDKSNNRLVDDLIQAYMFVGEYYARVQKQEDAKAHYTWAMKLASDMWKVTKNRKYEAMMNHLNGKV